MACSALIAPLLLAFAPSSEERHYTALDFLNFSQTVGAARGRHIVVFLDKGSSDYAEHERTLNAAVPNIECLVPGGIVLLAEPGREPPPLLPAEPGRSLPGVVGAAGTTLPAESRATEAAGRSDRFRAVSFGSTA